MKFDYLVEHPKYIPLVATWLYQEFIENQKPGISLEYIMEKLQGHQKEAVPITIIATKGNHCLGTVSLFENDLRGMEVTPWLAALVVDKQYRGRGIGKELIRQISTIALQLGYRTLYLRTEHATEYYQKLGWLFLDKRKDEFRMETNIFSKGLSL